MKKSEVGDECATNWRKIHTELWFGNFNKYKISLQLLL
jgi:hypothetical protein